MSSIPENRYSIKGSLFAVIILALLTLADNVLTNTLPFALGPGPPQIPGFWNLTTTSLVLSVVSGEMKSYDVKAPAPTNGSRLNRSTCSHYPNLSLQFSVCYQCQHLKYHYSVHLLAHFMYGRHICPKPFQTHS